MVSRDARTVQMAKRSGRSVGSNRRIRKEKRNKRREHVQKGKEIGVKVGVPWARNCRLFLSPPSLDRFCREGANGEEQERERGDVCLYGNEGQGLGDWK